VEFSHFDIPANFPSKVSLALFRVLQEALQNAVKHSHAQDFKIELRGAPGAIYLTVTDAGTGFDPVEAMGSRGLGLISMRERLQLANGSMSIESALDKEPSFEHACRSMWMQNRLTPSA